MSPSRIEGLRNFMRMLEEESREGHACAQRLLSLPSAAWESVLEQHPEWHRAGTIRALIKEAEELTPGHPARAHAITTFVLAHVHDVPIPIHGKVLAAPLEGEAYIAHGNAVLALGDASGALSAAVLAEELLSLIPVAFGERFDAQLLRARAWGFMERDDDALDLIDDCLRAYADEGRATRYVRALAARALLLCDMCQWNEARHTLRHAAETVSYVQSEPLAGFLATVIAQCSELGLPCGGAVVSLRA
jgi:hypothetical protein